MSKASGQRAEAKLGAGVAGIREEGGQTQREGGGRGRRRRRDRWRRVDPDSGHPSAGKPAPWSTSCPARLRPARLPLAEPGSASPVPPAGSGSLRAPPATCPPWTLSEELSGPVLESLHGELLSERSCWPSLLGGVIFLFFLSL